VSIDVHERPYSAGERVVLLLTRVLSATFFTALVGAIENWFYERFFAPDLYAAGPPLGRAMFTLGIAVPYILAGLIVLGLPAAYALRRMRAESALNYAAAGLVTGALWGFTTLSSNSYGIALAAFYGGVCALFWWWLRPRG